MKQLKYFIAAILLTTTTIAAGHTGLSTSVPENNQVLAMAPEQIELAFSGPVLLARIEFRDSAGEGIDLDLSAHTEAAESFVVDLPDALLVGKYTAHWTVLGGDGHTMVGALSFTVQGN